MVKRKSFSKILNSIDNVHMDTSIFIYYFEDNKEYGLLLDNFFKYLEKNKTKICISTLVLTELLVGPYKNNRLEEANKWLDYFKMSSLVSVLDFGPKIAIDAAYIRAKYNIKTPDSIHLATAMKNSNSVFITNDVKLKKVKEVKVLLIKELY